MFFIHIYIYVCVLFLYMIHIKLFLYIQEIPRIIVVGDLWESCFPSGGFLLGALLRRLLGGPRASPLLRECTAGHQPRSTRAEDPQWKKWRSQEWNIENGLFSQLVDCNFTRFYETKMHVELPQNLHK